MSTELKLTACKDCLHFLDMGSMSTDKKCGASPVLLFYPIKGERDSHGFHTVFAINTDGACPKYAEKPLEQEK
jgi:hypothetical protein